MFLQDRASGLRRLLFRSPLFDGVLGEIGDYLVHVRFKFAQRHIAVPAEYASVSSFLTVLMVRVPRIGVAFSPSTVFSSTNLARATLGC